MVQGSKELFCRHWRVFFLLFYLLNWLYCSIKSWILDHVDEIKAIQEPIIFCCASGQRSGMATQYFKEQGVDCSNGGGWRELQSTNL